MSYTPPIGSAVDFSGRSGYIPPNGDSVDFSAMPRFDIDVRSATTFVGIGNAFSSFGLNIGSSFSPETKERGVVISCASSAVFATNQRHVAIPGASSFSPIGSSSFPAVVAISEGSSASFEGMTVKTGAFSEYCSSSVTMQGVAEVRMTLHVRTKSDFLPLASFNKQMSFSIYGKSRFSPKANFNDPRSCSINGRSSALFKSVAESRASFSISSESSCGLVGQCTHSARGDLLGSSTTLFSSNYRSPSAFSISSGSSCAFDGDFSTQTLRPSPDGADNIFIRTRMSQSVVVVA